MNIKELGLNFIDQILSLSDKLLEKIPEDRRRLFLLILGGIIFLAICITIAVLAVSLGSPSGSSMMTAGSSIPSEELFYPGEPDFLPPLILEQEPHRPWTAGDLELLWHDPKTGNEDLWRETVKSAVDKLLDGIP